jgi:hypothetical protein
MMYSKVRPAAQNGSGSNPVRVSATRKLLGARHSDTSDTERFAAMEDDDEVNLAFSRFIFKVLFLWYIIKVETNTVYSTTNLMSNLYSDSERCYYIALLATLYCVLMKSQ